MTEGSVSLEVALLFVLGVDGIRLSCEYWMHGQIFLLEVAEPFVRGVDGIC